MSGIFYLAILASSPQRRVGRAHSAHTKMACSVTSAAPSNQRMDIESGTRLYPEVDERDMCLWCFFADGGAKLASR